MRSFALLSLSTVLALAACNEQEPATSATEAATATTTMEPATATETPGTTTTTTTTGESMTTTTGTATEALPTTGPTPTTGTTAEATTTTTTSTSTTTTTTGGETETETETASTTMMAVPSMGPYESCSIVNGIECDGNAACVDAQSTSGTVMGSFCAPKCMGQGTCPTPEGLDPDVQAICAFDTDMDMQSDICALLCVIANDDCPEGSMCEDIGIPPMQMMKFGVCTFPA